MKTATRLALNLAINRLNGLLASASAAASRACASFAGKVLTKHLLVKVLTKHANT